MHKVFTRGPKEKAITKDIKQVILFIIVLCVSQINSWENGANVPPTFLSVSTEEYSALGKRKAIVATRICIKDKSPVKQTIIVVLEAMW